MKKYVALALLIFTTTSFVTFYDQIKQVVILTAYAIACLLVVVLLLLAGFLIWYVLERLKIIQAKRIEAEKQAHVLTITAGNQVFVRETDQRATWRILHLEARTYSNSTFTEPSHLELQQWQWFNQPRKLPPKDLEAIPAHATVELLPALDNIQRCLVVGASDSGICYLPKFRPNKGRRVRKI